MLLDEFEKLKTPEIFKIISDNLDISSHELSMRLKNDTMLPHRAIAEQVGCNKKAKRKIPSFRNKQLLFDKIPLEQASSEFTAKYKASIISGNSLFDLTGGLGIDDIFFATSFKKVSYCELNEVTASIFEYNMTKLGIKNIEVNNTESINLLKQQKSNSIDWIYVDPARRDENRRSVDLEFCAPNVYDNMDLFFEKAKNVMIKAAPAYDITEAVRKFQKLKEIHVISVDGECKEVLLILDKNLVNKTPIVISVTLNSQNDDRFILKSLVTNKNSKKIEKLNTYFYEPECAIVKSNLTPLLANKYNLLFINNGSPFLTGSELVIDFPGRSFTVLTSISYNEKEIKKYLKQNGISKTNITRRDFRLSVDEIRKKLKLKDGGDIYLFFTSDLNKKGIMIISKRVSKT